MAARARTCGPLCGTFKRYLLQFAHEHLDFRVQEIKSVISMLGCAASLQEKDITAGSPFMEIDLPGEKEAKAVMQRTVLSKRLYELWAEGSTLTEVIHKLKQLPQAFIKPHTNENSSFRIVVETVNKKISCSEKVKRIEELTQPDSILKGKINLTTPDTSFHLLEFYKFDDSSSPTEPLKVYFGRWISDGQRVRIKEYHLQTRHFIANTSMDACLSMVMANLAQIRENDLVIDPFVGSGSLLVSSAHYGAYVIGTDIDYLLLHAKARPSRAKQKTRSDDESVRSNLKQYRLENKYVDVLVADASASNMWRDGGWRFDAVITDPPYGIREAAAKIKSCSLSEVKEVVGSPHYPQRTQYQLGDIYKDLLNFAAKFLAVGGRLVYWLPIYKADYSESNIPQHPCLELSFNCEQPLSTTISRRLITMVKVREYQEDFDPEGASIEVDHYESSSFRQRYFKSQEVAADAAVQRNS